MAVKLPYVVIVANSSRLDYYTLHVVYIKDIFKIATHNCEIYSYADDITIIAFKLNEILHKISIWLNDNVLSLNVGKTMHYFW